MPESPTLRPSRPDDLDYVVGLKERAMRADLERLGRWDPERSRARVAAAFDPARTRIIELRGERVGSVSLRPDELGGDGSVWLELFYLEPASQGRGIGSAVLRRVFDEVGDRMLRLDVVQGSRARALYERHGFEFEHEDEIDVFLMRRPISEGRRAG